MKAGGFVSAFNSHTPHQLCFTSLPAAGTKLWSNLMEILDEKDGVDTELLVYAMTLINKVSVSAGSAGPASCLRNVNTHRAASCFRKLHHG